MPSVKSCAPCAEFVRVKDPSVTAELGQDLLVRDPEAIPRELVASEEERPIYKFSTDIPSKIHRRRP
jgi:hypothetical protein